MLCVCVCVCVHSRFTENPPVHLEATNPSILMWFCHSGCQHIAKKWNLANGGLMTLLYYITCIATLDWLNLGWHI
jgi:hypothetical protein